MEGLVLGGTALLLMVLVVYPLLFLLYGSITKNGSLSLENFATAFSSRTYYSALMNSVLLGLGCAVVAVVVGAPMAWAVGRTNMPAKGVVRMLAYISYMTPPFLTAIAYVSLLSPNAGMINRLIVTLTGAGQGPFNIFSLWGMIFVTSTHVFPYVFMLTSSALESVDSSLEESAQMLGSGRIKTALNITLPLVTPAILSGALMAFVNAIALFGSQAILGLPARIYTLPTRIYALFNYPPKYELASALSILLIGLTVGSLYLQQRFLEKRSYVTMGGKGARPDLIDIGRKGYLALALCMVVFSFSVLLPYATLLSVSVSKSWGLDFLQNLTLANFEFVLFKYEVTRRAIINSLLLAVGAATIAIAIGTLISYIDLRTKLRGRKLLDYVSLIPLGLPGIVLAVGLVQAWLRAPINIYGTMAILLLAYVTRYIPLAVRSANSAIRQVDASLEESARITGASWLRTLSTVTIPLTRRGLFAGWLLVFVPALQELSASILLFTSATTTLAVAVYNLYETGQIEPVAALAIVNMAVITAALSLASKLGGGPMAGSSTTSR
ncbi:MAG: ABC transporter permease [Chloroflexota bacterium]